jgi:threonylcarbamoyladenosine tRNA methylthiotransferase MtaB
MRKIKIITLGCKVNQAESEDIARQLSGSDWQTGAGSEEADVLLVNTCAVTQKAAMQSRQAVRQAIRANPAARVVVTGCYAQTDPAALRGIAGVDLIVDRAAKGRLPEILHGAGGIACQRPELPGDRLKKTPAAGARPAAGGLNRTRPFLKIQDGCEAFCAYCIVPYARGPSRSMPFQEVLERLSAHAAAGTREVVLAGIHLGRYGRDLAPQRDLVQLLAAVEAASLPMRVRLSSIEPLELTDDILTLVAGSTGFCRHFHIPLQSGDPGILALMGRPYSPGRFEALVRRIKALMPDAAIGSDVLVGFPGETPAAWENTLELIERLPLSYLHVFPFSPRPGTAACELPARVTAADIKQRCRRLRDIGRQKRAAFHRSFIGRRVQVLVEGRRDPRSGMLKGISANYLPVFFPGESSLFNRMALVAVTAAGPEGLEGGNVG